MPMEKKVRTCPNGFRSAELDAELKAPRPDEYHTRSMFHGEDRERARILAILTVIKEKYETSSGARNALEEALEAIVPVENV